MRTVIRDYLHNHLQAIDAIATALDSQLCTCAELVIEVVSAGNKVLIFGNGGSAADAQHFAAELVGRFRRERKGIPAIALTTDTSALTAIGNDYGFEFVFSRQVNALAQAGDVVIGLSTSGNSPNVLKAMQAARAAGCTTIGLLGKDGGKIAGGVDHALVVPVVETSHVQECHIVIIHLLCELIERSLVEVHGNDE